MKNINNIYFTVEDVQTAILEALEGFNGYYSELVDAAFNQSYYIIGTYQSEVALSDYGVFEALREVRDYEMENFGECYTDISNPEKLANMLFYIKGIQYLNNNIDLYSLLDEIEVEKELDYTLSDSEATDEINALLIEKLKATFN